MGVGATNAGGLLKVELAIGTGFAHAPGGGAEAAGQAEEPLPGIARQGQLKELQIGAKRLPVMVICEANTEPWFAVLARAGGH